MKKDPRAAIFIDTTPRARLIILQKIHQGPRVSRAHPGRTGSSMAHIVIDRDRCKGCCFCIEFCPRNLIRVSREHNRIGYFPAEFIEEERERCTGCKTCAVMCPDTAIEVYK